MATDLGALITAADFVQRANHPKYIDLISREHCDIIAIPINGTCTNFLKSKNKGKNRFPYFTCWDISRVVLTNTSDGTDYINANYVSSYGMKKFVAAEQPTASTLDYFWSMIWQEDSRVIVVLTSFGEELHPNCVLKDFIVKEESINLELYYTTSTLSVTHKQTGEMKTVYRFKYLNWPENGVPDIEGFIEFLLVINKQYQVFFLEAIAARRFQPGPIIVYGKAGVGRTATFCVADSCLYQLVHTASISVPSAVLKIRQQRRFSMLSQTQYIFIYSVLLHFLLTIRSGMGIFLELRSYFTAKDGYLLNL